MLGAVDKFITGNTEIINIHNLNFYIANLIMFITHYL